MVADLVVVDLAVADLAAVDLEAVVPAEVDNPLEHFDPLLLLSLHHYLPLVHNVALHHLACLVKIHILSILLPEDVYPDV